MHGIININTAGEETLRALRGVTPELARAIVTGTDSSGRTRLKPYKNISDLLDVRGMTSEIFANICNLITTRSDQYRVIMTAEVIEDVNRDGKFDPGIDRVNAQSQSDMILDRADLTDDDTGTRQFRMMRAL